MSHTLSTSSLPKRILTSRFAAASVAVLGLILSASEVRADHDPTEADHPLVIVAGASFDRLMDRTIDVLEINGVSMTREQIVAYLRASGAMTGTAAEDSEKWFDATKPIGLMFFFGTLDVTAAANGPNPPDDPDEQDDEAAKPAEKLIVEDLKPGEDPTPEQPGLGVNVDGTDLMQGLFDSLEGANLTRVAAFVPIKNYAEFLSAGKLTPVTGKPNCFVDDKGVESCMRRFGEYVVIGQEAELINNCPDPRGLARSLVGKNDVVVSVQMKGLPPLLRTLGAEGIKAAYDATLQQRDDEAARDYQLRRAAGDLLRDFLDLAVSQIDQINLGVRLEVPTRQLVVELDLVGEKNGDLAKAAAELTPKRVPFENLWNQDSELSIAVSAALPERHAKPIAAAIRNYVRTASEPDEIKTLELYAPLIEAGCKILDARQFDFAMTSYVEGQLIALAVPGGPRFPEQVQQFLETTIQLADEKIPFQLAADAVLGWPAHFVAITSVPMLISFAEDQPSQPDKRGGCWIVATPQGLWVGITDHRDKNDLPEFLRTAIEEHSAKRPAVATQPKRPKVPYRMKIHTRTWFDTPDSSETPEGDEDDDAEAIRRREARIVQAKATKDDIRNVYQDKSDAISIELHPTPTGWRQITQLDEVYLVLLGRYFTETFGGGSSVVPSEPEPAIEKE